MKMQQSPPTLHLNIDVTDMAIVVTTGVMTGNGHAPSDGHALCGMAGDFIERFMPSGTTRMAERIHG